MRLLALVSVVAVALLAPGCEQKPEPPKKAESKTFEFISVFPDPVLVAKGADSAKAEGTTVKVTATKSAEDQVRELQRIASSGGIDGVAIECIPTAEVTAAVAKCFQAGVPVVTFGSDCFVQLASAIESPAVKAGAVTGRQSFVGMPLSEVGNTLAGLLVTRLGKTRGVVVVLGFDHPSFKAIEDAAVACLKNIPDLQVKGPIHVANTEAAVKEAVDAAIREEKNIQGWVILNPAAATKADAAPLAAIGTVPVVLFSASPEAYDSVGETKLAINVVSIPYVQCAQVAVQMLDGLTRDGLSYSDMYPVPLLVVKPETLAAVKAALDGQAVAPAVPSGGPKPLRPAKPETPPAAPSVTPEQPAAGDSGATGAPEPAKTDAPPADAGKTDPAAGAGGGEKASDGATP